MEQINKYSFTFWVYPFEFLLIVGRAFSAEKLLKCSISEQNVLVKTTSNETVVDLPIKSINYCKSEYGDMSLICDVRIRTSDNREILFIPVNPFDPPVYFHRNEAESKAMALVINCLRIGAEPDFDPNPYIRQLSRGDVPKNIESSRYNWDGDTSPWVYYQSNAGDEDGKRKRAVIIGRVFVIILGLIVMAGFIYLVYYFISK